MNLLKRCRKRRDRLDAMAVLEYLSQRQGFSTYSSDICRATGLKSIRVINVIAMLEQENLIVADWADQPIGPQRRWYRLPNTSTNLKL